MILESDSIGNDEGVGRKSKYFTKGVTAGQSGTCMYKNNILSLTPPHMHYARDKANGFVEHKTHQV